MKIMLTLHYKQDSPPPEAPTFLGSVLKTLDPVSEPSYRSASQISPDLALELLKQHRESRPWHSISELLAAEETYHDLFGESRGYLNPSDDGDE